MTNQTPEKTPMMVYITTASAEEATRIGRRVVEDRLAACANILPGMHSIYRWEEGVQEDDECVLILKTRAANLTDLTARVKTLHSYDVPCISAIEIVDGNPDYFAWIVEETKAR